MRLLRRSYADPKVTWLASLPWWSDLRAEDLRVLASTGDRVSVPAGSTMMTEGQRGRETAVIISGDVAVVHDGHVLARLGPGEVVGELSMLDGVPRNADVRTVTNVELLVFSLEGFRQALAASAELRSQFQAAADAHRG